MTITSILKSWESIRNTEMACKLIAAAIKTCRVAHHICSQKNIETSRYLSDAYLQCIVEVLWTLWRDAAGVSQVLMLVSQPVTDNIQLANPDNTIPTIIATASIIIFTLQCYNVNSASWAATCHTNRCNYGPLVNGTGHRPPVSSLSLHITTGSTRDPLSHECRGPCQ